MRIVLPQMRAFGGVLPHADGTALITAAAVIGKPDVRNWSGIECVKSIGRLFIGDVQAHCQFGEGTE
jgi:hypothetical protein